MPAWLAELIDTLLPVMALVGGWAMALVVENRRHDRERKLAKGARGAERDVRWATFQRETLIDLQDAVQRYMRAHGAIMHRDIMTSREAGEWTPGLAGEEWSQQAFDAGVELTMLGPRVDDDEVRRLVEQMKTTVGPIAVGVTGSEEASHEVMNEALDLLQRFHALTGELLRTARA